MKVTILGLLSQVLFIFKSVGRIQPGGTIGMDEVCPKYFLAVLSERTMVLGRLRTVAGSPSRRGQVLFAYVQFIQFIRKCN